MRTTKALGALAGLGVLTSGGIASAYDMSTSFYVTAYAYDDNSCVAPDYDSPGDCIATPGRGGDYRAVFSTDNTFEHPTTLAVPQQYLDGEGPSDGRGGHYFVEGDLVLIDGLGWFKVEDACSDCTNDYPGTLHVDAWLGFGKETDEEHITGTDYTVHVFHPADDPGTLGSASAGSLWLGPKWVSAGNQGGRAWAWIDSGLEQWQDELIDNFDSSSTNEYVSGGDDVRWDPSYNESDCSGFLSAVLGKAYGYSERHNAATFFDDITSGSDGFAAIETIDQMSPGDIIALKYAANDPAYPATGHIMTVNADSWVFDSGSGTWNMALDTNAYLHGPPSGTYDAYDVVVADSADSGHSNDTRAAGTDGAGKGTIRLFADKSTRAIVGYTWSMSTGSWYYGTGSTVNPNRQIIVGRYGG